MPINIRKGVNLERAQQLRYDIFAFVLAQPYSKAGAFSCVDNAMLCPNRCVQIRTTRSPDGWRNKAGSVTQSTPGSKTPCYFWERELFDGLHSVFWLLCTSFIVPTNIEMRRRQRWPTSLSFASSYSTIMRMLPLGPFLETVPILDTLAWDTSRR